MRPVKSEADPMQTLRGRQSERQGFLGAGRILLDVMTDVAGIFSVTKDWENGQMADITKGRFDFHRGGGKHEPVPVTAYVQIYVKSSVLSRAPDLAISAHLMTEAGIDEFVDDALAELEEIRIAAKKALAAADSN